jgi:hypothetical protein
MPITRAHGALSFSFFSSSNDIGGLSSDLIFPARHFFASAICQ